MIYYNGNFQKEDYISNYKGYNYGIGCFETIMLDGKKAVFFKEHIARMKRAMEYLKIEREINFNEIVKQLIENEIIEDNEEQALKIIVTDRDISVTIKKIHFRDEPDGVYVKLIEDMYQNEFGFIKSISYAQNYIAFENIKKDGFYEGIFMNREGNVTEGCVSNIFFIKNGVVFTPELRLNILPGIVRSKIMGILRENDIKVVGGEFKKTELFGADAVFLSNSLMKKGCIRVKNINGINKGEHEIIKLIESEFEKLKEKNAVHF